MSVPQSDRPEYFAMRLVYEYMCLENAELRNIFCNTHNQRVLYVPTCGTERGHLRNKTDDM